MKKLINVFVFGLILLFCGCTPTNDQKAQSFLDDIKKYFEENENPVPLSDFTNFKWDEVCYFGWDDSEPGQALKSYNSFVELGILEEMDGEIPKEDYQHLFVFLNEKKISNYIGIMSSRLTFKEGFSAWIGLSSKLQNSNPCIKYDNAALKMNKVTNTNGNNSSTSYASIILYNNKFEQ